MNLLLYLHFVPNDSGCMADNLHQLPAAAAGSRQNLGKAVRLLEGVYPDDVDKRYWFDADRTCTIPTGIV